MKILGVKVDEISRQETIDKISSWIGKREGLKHVVTIYSEFLLVAEKDEEFKKATKKADLVVPDGVGVLAALEYKKITTRAAQHSGRDLRYASATRRRVALLFAGLRVGVDGLRGNLGEPVTGVWLFEELVGLAAKNGWKVFLLGGFGDTAERLAEKLKNASLDPFDSAKASLRMTKRMGLQVEFDAGEQRVGRILESSQTRPQNDEVIEKINEFKPDLLFVAYGPIKQEKWIYKNKGKLKAKVAIGLGGTFDEVLGEFPRTPEWMEKRGLKALWRLVVQPKRLPRIWRGMVVFPFRVWRRRG